MTQSIDTGEDPHEWAAQKIEELVPEKNECGLTVYHTEWGAFCRTEEAEAIIKELKAENERLNNALDKERKDGIPPRGKGANSRAGQTKIQL